MKMMKMMVLDFVSKLELQQQILVHLSTKTATFSQMLL